MWTLKWSERRCQLLGETSVHQRHHKSTFSMMVARDDRLEVFVFQRFLVCYQYSLRCSISIRSLEIYQDTFDKDKGGWKWRQPTHIVRSRTRSGCAYSQCKEEKQNDFFVEYCRLLLGWLAGWSYDQYKLDHFHYRSCLARYSTTTITTIFLQVDQQVFQVHLQVEWFPKKIMKGLTRNCFRLNKSFNSSLVQVVHLVWSGVLLFSLLSNALPDRQCLDCMCQVSNHHHDHRAFDAPPSSPIIAADRVQYCNARCLTLSLKSSRSLQHFNVTNTLLVIIVTFNYMFAYVELLDLLMSNWCLPFWYAGILRLQAQHSLSQHGRWPILLRTLSNLVGLLGRCRQAWLQWILQWFRKLSDRQELRRSDHSRVHGQMGNRLQRRWSSRLSRLCCHTQGGPGQLQSGVVAAKQILDRNESMFE